MGIFLSALSIVLTFLFIADVSIPLSLIMLGLNALLIWALYFLSCRLAPYSEARARSCRKPTACWWTALPMPLLSKISEISGLKENTIFAR